jgi:ribosomal protein S27AE
VTSLFLVAPAASATKLRESTDLMGYGWIGDAPDPLFSQCDLDAFAYVWSWALDGSGSSGPGPSDLALTSTACPNAGAGVLPPSRLDRRRTQCQQCHHTRRKHPDEARHSIVLGVSALWILRQVLVDPVFSQRSAQLGQLCLVDNVNALALLGGFAGHRGIQEVDVLIGQAE